MAGITEAADLASDGDCLEEELKHGMNEEDEEGPRTIERENTIEIAYDENVRH